MSTKQNEPCGWVVWSNEHRAWWRANGCGYATSLLSAGVYAEIEAKEIARKGSGNEEAHTLAEALGDELAKSARDEKGSANAFILRRLVGQEDTKRLDKLEAEALEEALTLHDGEEPFRVRMVGRGLGFGPKMGRSLRDAIDGLPNPRRTVSDV